MMKKIYFTSELYVKPTFGNSIMESVGDDIATWKDSWGQD